MGEVHVPQERHESRAALVEVLGGLSGPEQQEEKSIQVLASVCVNHMEIRSLWKARTSGLSKSKQRVHCEHGHGGDPAGISAASRTSKLTRYRTTTTTTTTTRRPPGLFRRGSVCGSETLRSLPLKHARSFYVAC